MIQHGDEESLYGTQLINETCEGIADHLVGFTQITPETYEEFKSEERKVKEIELDEVINLPRFLSKFPSLGPSLRILRHPHQIKIYLIENPELNSGPVLLILNDSIHEVGKNHGKVSHAFVLNGRTFFSIWSCLPGTDACGITLYEIVEEKK